MKTIKRIALLSVTGAVLFIAASAAQAPAGLKVTEFGKGPTVVLVHGLGGGRMSWMPVARKLLVGHHVVMVDLPGHGDSPLPDPFSLDACGDELAATLAKSDPKNTVVVGLGLGGLIALKALDRRPGLVGGLMLVEAAAKAPMQIPDQQQKFFMQQLDSNYEGFMQMMYGEMARDSAQGVKLRAEAMRVEPRNIKAYMRYLLNADASGALNKIKIPVLFVASERRWPDTKEWPAVASELGYDDPARLPARRVMDSGYMIQFDQPDTLAAMIAQFTSEALAKK